MSTITSAITSMFGVFLDSVQTLCLYIFGGTLGEGSTAVTIEAQPLLIFFLLLPVVGIAVGLFKRLINVN